MILRERDTAQGLLVSVCDQDVLGETFEDGEVSLTVEPEFYDGDSADEDAVVECLGRADVANLVGTRAVAVAVEAGIIDEANVLDVGETQHAQYLRL